MPQQQRIQLIIYIVDVAKSDKNISAEEKQAQYRIAAAMGLSSSALDQIRGHDRVHHYMIPALF